MANAYINAVLPLNLPFGQKSVLVALANRANEKTGECFPRVRCISADTGLARSTIHAHIKTLIKDEYIEKVNQYRKDGSQTANLYKLLMEPVKKAAKKVKEAVKKVFDKPVDMGNKEFDGKIGVPALSAEIVPVTEMLDEFSAYASSHSVEDFKYVAEIIKNFFYYHIEEGTTRTNKEWTSSIKAQVKKRLPSVRKALNEQPKTTADRFDRSWDEVEFNPESVGEQQEQVIVGECF